MATPSSQEEPPEKPLLPPARTERAIFAELEGQRRLRLARGIALLFSILTAVFAIPILTGYLAIPHHPGFSWTTFNKTDLFVLEESTDLVLGGVLLFGYIAARRGRVNLAVASVTVSFVFGLIIFELGQFVNSGKIDAIGITSFIPLNTIIVLVGLLADPPLIIGTTLVMNLFVILAVQILPLDPSLPFPKSYLQTTLPILQWGVAIVMLAGWRNFRETFLELGKSQVEIDRARQMDDLKNQFIASVNHELRNPVMVLHGYMQLFLMSAGRVPFEDRAALIEEANVAGKDLVALIESILDIRRLDQDDDDYAPTAVDIRDALLTATRLIDPREVKGQERELVVSIPPQLAIWGEKIRLQQILTNLLSNAVKYSFPGSSIEVQARTVMHSGRRGQPPVSEVEITVQDHGLGIPPDQVPLLFNRFVRLPRDLASSVIGNGLGLYLCRLYSEDLGGKIWVESTGVAGEGSRFVLRLPVPPVEVSPRETTS